MDSKTRILLGILLVGIALLNGCVEKNCDVMEDNIKQKINDLNYCEVDSDCTTTYFGCPFGCYTIINKDADLTKIKNLVDIHNKDCGRCFHNCMEFNKELVCENGTCITKETKMEIIVDGKPDEIGGIQPPVDGVEAEIIVKKFCEPKDKNYRYGYKLMRDIDNEWRIPIITINGPYYATVNIETGETNCMKHIPFGTDIISKSEALKKANQLLPDKCNATFTKIEKTTITLTFTHQYLPDANKENVCPGITEYLSEYSDIWIAEKTLIAEGPVCDTSIPAQCTKGKLISAIALVGLEGKFVCGYAIDHNAPQETKILFLDEVCESTRNCAKEGELINFPKGINKNLPDECCDGLKGLAGFGINKNGECERIKGGPFLTCMPCGNGVCETINNFQENKCNCPEDCAEKGVTITTDKIGYEQGETVKITVKNNLEKSIRYLNGHSGCSDRNKSYTVYQFVSGTWEDTSPPVKCIALVGAGSPVYKELKSNKFIEFMWNCKMVDSMLGEIQAPSGRYKFSVTYKKSNDVEDIKTTHSNEFTIKEKSEIDPRCSEKIKTANCNIGDNDVVCQGMSIASEFNSNTGKCIKITIPCYCSFETPFRSLEECQMVCEKEDISKIGSYLTLLMNKNGLQEQYGVDIEFSGELSDEKLTEIKNNYEITFSRLPDGSITHTTQFYGATTDGHAINQLTGRSDVIRIVSTEQPVSM